MNAPELAHVLLQHQGFLRALARRLVAPDEADDLVQDAWVQTLERPPRSTEGLRLWLRTVTRNLASNRFRQAGGRADRERQAARPEAIAAVDEDVTQAELLRAVLDAVLALDEPYRATILGRYFRGESAARIATAAGVPVATVRSREQRALARLRGRLDRERGRDEWSARLLVWLGLHRSAAPAIRPGFPPAIAQVAVLVSVVGLGALAVRELVTARTDPLPLHVARGEAEVAASPIPVPDVRYEPSTSSRAAREAVPASEIRGSGSPDARGGNAGLSVEQTEIRGRVLTPDGQPVAGQSVELSWSAVDANGLADPEALEGMTEEDGRFAFVVERIRGDLWYSASVKRPGFVREVRSLFSSEPEDVHHLGDLVLRRGGTVDGLVIDSEGQPVLEQSLEVSLEVGGDPSGNRRVREDAHVDATGHFLLEDLPPGRAKLLVRTRHSPRRESTEPAFATIEAGATVTVEVVWAPPPPPEDIRLQLERWPITMVLPDVEHVRSAPAAGRISVQGHEIVLADLPEGPFTVEIDDPRFGYWRQEGLERGARPKVRLEGSSTVWLDVRGAQGESLEPYSVEAVLPRLMSRPNRFVLREATAPLPGGRLPGLVAGDYELVVAVPELGSRTIVVADLAPGESRTVTARFDVESVLSGYVRDSGGTSLPEVQVTLLRPAQQNDSPDSRVLLANSMSSDSESCRLEIDRTWTDAAGTFRFDGLPAGTYALYAGTEGRETATAALDVAEGGTRTVDLVLPRAASLAGTITGIAPDETLRVLVHRAAEERTLRMRHLTAPLGADGTYRLDGLPPGECSVHLQLAGPIETGLAYQGTDVLGCRTLGTVTLEDGQQASLDADASSLRPGRLVVQVFEHDQPAAGLRVALLSPVMDRGREECVAITDSDGRAELPAFPGQYPLRVTDVARRRSQEEPGVVTISSGDAITRVVDFAPAPD